MNIVETLCIKRQKVEFWNEVLAGAAVEDADRDGVLETFTVKFPGTDYEADIKIVNGDPSPYVDAVLFDSGAEVCVIPDVADKLDGEYVFDMGENKYVVKVVGV